MRKPFPKIGKWGAALKFKESLPVGCPPTEANSTAFQENAYRMIPAETATQEDFDSHQKLGKENLGGHSLCYWSACSFFTNLDIIRKKRNAFKKLRKFTHAALVQISAGAGHWVCEDQHVSLWMSEAFDPVAAIVKVEVL